MTRPLNLSKALLLVGLLLIAIGATACTSVPPGHVGIVVNNYGSQRGVQDFPVSTGRVWYNPMTEDVYQFPTSVQTVSWTRDKHEGTETDQSITFNSSEGAVINADISCSYSIVGDKVPHIFVKYHKTAEELTGSYVRSQVRDEFGRVGSLYKVIDIFGEKKGEVLDKVKSQLKERLEGEGFSFDNVSFIGALRVDETVHNSILQTIKATQDAQSAENKVKQTQAEAEQAVAQAKGEAESMRLRAEAQAQANITLAKSISPALTKYMLLEKWNGVLPQVQGSGTTSLISIDK